MNLKQMARWIGVRALRYSGVHPQDPALRDWFGGGTMTNAGECVDEQKALTYSAVFACVRVIAETTSILPFIVYRRVEPRGKVRLTTHPAYRLLHDQASPEMTAMAFREAITGHVLTWGNGYAEIERDQAERPIALHLLTPDRVRPDRMGGRLVYYVRGVNGAERPAINPDDILHVAGLGYDGIVGYSPIRMSQESVGLGMAANRYGAGFFKNGSRPGGVLQHPGQIKSLERIDQLKRHWEDLHQGAGNSHKVAILEDGMTWQAMGVGNNEAQFLESRQFQVEEIARFYRMPLHKIGHLLHATFSNIEHQSIEFLTDTMLPWLTRWEQEVKRKLFPDEPDVFAEHLVDGLLRGDTASRSTALATQFNNGALSIDEWRAIENRDPLPDGAGARYFVPLNLVPVDQLLAGKSEDQTDPAADPPPDNAPPADPNAAPVTDVQATALNGAQVTSLLEVVTKVSTGEIPKESAKPIIQASFPTFGADLINSIIDPIEAKAPEPAKAPAPPPDAGGGSGDPPANDPPANDPPPNDQQQRSAVQIVLGDAIQRMLRREAEALRRASKSPADFLDRLDAFYAGHQATYRRAIEPAARAMAALGGAEIRAEVLDELAVAHCEANRLAVLELAGLARPDDLAEIVETHVRSWSAEPCPFTQQALTRMIGGSNV